MIRGIGFINIWLSLFFFFTDNQRSHIQDAYFKSSEAFSNVGFPRELDFDDIKLDFDENFAATNPISKTFDTRGMYSIIVMPKLFLKDDVV